MKIAILLDSMGKISNINNTNNEGAIRQAALDDSLLVDANSEFKLNESYK